MKEIIENGIAYIVSDNYPLVPYTKTAKTIPSPAPPVDPLAAINAKLDALILDIVAIKLQTKAK